jgi:hypothetical protein
MTSKSMILLVLILVTTAASKVFAHPTEDWERALIGSPWMPHPRISIIRGPYTRAIGPLDCVATQQIQTDALNFKDHLDLRHMIPWFQPGATLPCCCNPDGSESSARIDAILADYGHAPMNELALGVAWSNEAVGCARHLLEQKRFGEAFRFSQKEMQRARAYREEMNMGRAATFIEDEIRRLLLDANLLGCD